MHESITMNAFGALRGKRVREASEERGEIRKMALSEVERDR